MNAVVTGAAGFLGSHLCDALLAKGCSVTGIDNFATGKRENLLHAATSSRFALIEADLCDGPTVPDPVDVVYHLASPASPVDYLRLPFETLAVGSRGTEVAIAVALDHRARFVLASTSEIYGAPEVHPQSEDYWGHVNPIGPRSVYDEAKRFAEALTVAYWRERGLRAGVVRIFNTYGPRLRPTDGRVVSNFIRQALAGEALTVYGDGQQTRSLCYVDDLIEGFLRMGDTNEAGPFNLGNPHEVTIAELAEHVLRLTGSASTIERRPLPVDDPPRRCPDISRASSALSWAPTISLEEGLWRTIDWARAQRRGTRRASAGSST